MAYTGKDAISVLLTTEGTYPTVRGGVSTWCDMLVRGVKGVEYQIYTILGHPHLANRYSLPTGVNLIRVPMWGTEEPSEHLDIRFSTVYERKLRTTSRVINQEFIPLFDQLLSGVFSDHHDGRQIGRLLYDFYAFFRQYDYLEAFKAEPVWNYYLKGIQTSRWAKLNALPTLLEGLQTLGWLYRFLIVLNTPVPKTDVTHSSAAAFCGLPGVLAKMEHRTPFLLTEHGVYLREQYLSIGKSGLTTFAKQSLLGLIKVVTSVNYAYADLVTPVAAFNARWERRLGVSEDRIRVIYNGVSPETYVPRPRPAGAPLTVVSVARIDPVKDIETLIRAAAVVKQAMPEVKFMVYGGVSVPSYHQRCIEVRDELGLQDTFIFAGHVNDVPAAYGTADVVVLSSITEGFPYAVVEAMMSGRAVVATDVGGTREACDGVGLLVQPRNPDEMAAAVLKLLRDPALRHTLAEEARERALAYFTIQRNLDLYRQTYENLAQKMAAVVPLSDLVARRRQLSVDRAQALVVAGQLPQAIQEYRIAADLEPEGPSTPALVLQVAELYLLTGDVDRSWREIERAEALAAALELRHAA